MKVVEIIKSVRLSMDEEPQGSAEYSAASAGDSPSLDNIIKQKLGDAMRWVSIYAPIEQLSGGGGDSSSGVSILKDLSGELDASGRVRLGKDFVRLVRVRCSDWHRSVMGDSLIREDSDEYLQLSDSYAGATADRPQAVVIEKAEKEVEVWPHTQGNNYEITELVLPPASVYTDITPETDINIPPMVRTSYLYYLTFLVLSAYSDPRADRMLEIAKMNLGLDDDHQRV